MRYRIEFSDVKCCKYADSREELLKWLQKPHEGIVSDIRKVYANGATDSVMDKYRPFMNDRETYTYTRESENTERSRVR